MIKRERQLFTGPILCKMHFSSVLKSLWPVGKLLKNLNYLRPLTCFTIYKVCAKSHTSGYPLAVMSQRAQ